MPTRLPLFPLGAVMVPGLVMPLHIFEQRYRILVTALAALPEGVPRTFGIIAIRQGADAGPKAAQSLDQLHPVGCTASLREITPHDDGRFDIVAVGQNRFRLLGLDPDAGTPYLTGQVELLDEPEGLGPLPELVEQVCRQFAAYRAALRVGPTDLPDDPQVVSYLVAAAAVLPLEVRQSLLEEPTISDRLGAERRILRQERRIIEEIRSIPAVDLAARPPHLN